MSVPTPLDRSGRFWLAEENLDVAVITTVTAPDNSLDVMNDDEVSIQVSFVPAISQPGNDVVLNIALNPGAFDDDDGYDTETIPVAGALVTATPTVNKATVTVNTRGVGGLKILSITNNGTGSASVDDVAAFWGRGKRG